MILQVIMIAQFVAHTIAIELFQREFEACFVRWNCEWNQCVLGRHLFVVVNSTNEVQK